MFRVIIIYSQDMMRNLKTAMLFKKIIETILPKPGQQVTEVFPSRKKEEPGEEWEREQVAEQVNVRKKVI